MKELTAEEKAKRYDKAIEIAKEINNEHQAQPFDVMTRVFPELKKSEDERIKKEITEFLKKASGGFLDTTTQCKTFGKWLAWLEKQDDKDKLIQELGEYKVKYTQEVLEKHLKTINKDDERLRKTTIAFLKDFAEQGYENAVECIDWLEKHEQKPIDKVEPKFKVGDKVLIDGKVCTIKPVNEDNYIVDENGRDVQEHFSYAKDWKLIEQRSVEWSEEDLPEFESYLCLMFQKFRTKGICTNGEIIDYVKEHSQKLKDTLCHAWSEEDEKFVHGLIRGLAAKRDIHGHTTFSSDCIDITETINWLKSLRPQKQWKPSKEQMDALNDVISSRDIKYDVLSELWKDLKQLK